MLNLNGWNGRKRIQWASVQLAEISSTFEDFENGNSTDITIFKRSELKNT